MAFDRIDLAGKKVGIYDRYTQYFTSGRKRMEDDDRFDRRIYNMSGILWHEALPSTKVKSPGPIPRLDIFTSSKDQDKGHGNLPGISRLPFLGSQVTVLANHIESSEGSAESYLLFTVIIRSAPGWICHPAFPPEWGVRGQPPAPIFSSNRNRH